MSSPAPQSKGGRLLSLPNIRNGSQVPYSDRIDIHIEVPPVDYEKLSGDRLGELSECIRARVQSARNIQQARFTNHPSTHSQCADIICNADMRVGEIRQFCRLPEDGQSLMRAAITAQFIGAGVSSYPQAGAHDCGFGW